MKSWGGGVWEGGLEGSNPLSKINLKWDGSLEFAKRLLVCATRVKKHTR